MLFRSVCVHIPACCEAAHEGNVKQKVLALEAIDHYLIRAAKTFYEAEKDVRVLISPLLTTPTQLKAPVRESVPFVIAGKNVMPDENEHLNEPLAQLSQLRFSDGWKLIDLLITGKEAN